MFDNEEYDCRTPEVWLALGNLQGLPDRKPIPAKALLPKDDKILSGNIYSQLFYITEDRHNFCSLIVTLFFLV